MGWRINRSWSIYYQGMKAQRQSYPVLEVYSSSLYRRLLRATIYSHVCHAWISLPWMASQTLCSIQLASSYNAAMGPIYFAPLLFKCKTQGYLFLMKIAVILKVWSLMFYIYNCRYMKKTGYEFLHLDLLSQVQTHLCVFFFNPSGKHLIPFSFFLRSIMET